MAKASRKINLIARWNVVFSYICQGRPEGELQIFDPGSRTWEFRPDGHLIEIISEIGESAMDYSFYSDTKTLRIDRRGFEPDGVLWTRQEESFRAVAVGEVEIVLYDMSDDDPANLVFRQIVLRQLR